MGNTQALIFCWLLLLLVDIDAATFEFNVTIHSQDTTLKQFEWQLTVATNKQNVSSNANMEEKIFDNPFKEKHKILEMISVDNR